MCRLESTLLLWTAFGVGDCIAGLPGRRPPRPLKGGVSDIFGIPTALPVPGGSGNTVTASPSLSLGILSEPGTTEASALSTGNIQTDTLTTPGLSIISSATMTAESEQQTASGTAAPPSSAGSPGSASLAGTVTASQAGQSVVAATLSTSGGASISIVPTATDSGSGSSSLPSSSRSGGGSSSGSVSGSGSTSGPGPGSGSGSGSGTGSKPSTAETSSSSGLSPGEIAVSVILPIVALIAILFLCFRYMTPLRKRFTSWRQERLERRTYRRALDDPVLSFGVREKGLGLGLGDVEQLARPLSFGFQRPQPQRQGTVLREPLGWDGSRLVRGSDRISAIGMAVPMGSDHRRTESESSDESLGEEARLNQSRP
ncbi:uncharacterized protein HMPREF1120_07956 [Exophiala dermatitidis NIH/UT8656]|uniref:Uncharacterized protein n=1 Tax=Exophiala dermatitidis (strain ATCC 34100 / CBS 525.76 / NIH/UT8656) TaxID=858893 RepID=H6CA17_EXODN|nr:uncharacterized protein HMPREF1120_07956 [Exophiala dermatitidis NIH/UT8656]EHY59981.1 hypothetical protein HMPREF1120_07956 [Exophiala dermatitidis NIH/UT8656]